tara:strand:- start:905 stop:1060 length:156 start_codon:yes stop_codon:yes gene_type:complete
MSFDLEKFFTHSALCLLLLGVIKLALSPKNNYFIGKEKHKNIYGITFYEFK